MSDYIISSKVRPIQRNENTLLKKYLTFTESQMEHRTLWFLIPLILLPTAIMPVSIILMYGSSWYLAFVGLSIILFFSNVVINIAQLPTKVTISVFLFTVLIHILLPSLALILQ
jgi:hypothetical protein